MIDGLQRLNCLDVVLGWFTNSRCVTKVQEIFALRRLINLDLLHLVSSFLAQVDKLTVVCLRQEILQLVQKLFAPVVEVVQGRLA